MKMTVNDTINAIADIIKSDTMRCLNCPILTECTEEHEDAVCLDRDLLIEVLRSHYKSNESETCDGIPKYGRNAKGA